MHALSCRDGPGHNEDVNDNAAALEPGDDVGVPVQENPDAYLVDVQELEYGFSEDLQ